MVHIYYLALTSKYISSSAPAVPESALPIGMEKEDGSTQLIPVEPSECVCLPILLFMEHNNYY